MLLISRCIPCFQARVLYVYTLTGLWVYSLFSSCLLLIKGLHAKQRNPMYRSVTVNCTVYGIRVYFVVTGTGFVVCNDR